MCAAMFVMMRGGAENESLESKYRFYSVAVTSSVADHDGEVRFEVREGGCVRGVGFVGDA